jgi:single-strand DNA-binding protein
MNSVQLIGRLTAQPEVRFTPKGMAVANGTLAIDDGFGENKTTLFIGITFWGKTAETAGEHLVKGQRIGVTGRLSQEEFTPKDSDKPVRKTHVTVISFDFLDKPQGYERGERQPKGAAANGRNSLPPQEGLGNTDGGEDEADDIPF